MIFKTPYRSKVNSNSYIYAYKVRSIRFFPHDFFESHTNDNYHALQSKLPFIADKSNSISPLRGRSQILSRKAVINKKFRVLKFVDAISFPQVDKPRCTNNKVKNLYKEVGKSEQKYESHHRRKLNKCTQFLNLNKVNKYVRTGGSVMF